MKFTLPEPVNETQRQFRKLCELGGGRGGGPARGKVQELLHESGMQLNAYGHQEATEHLAANADRNPWHVCFAVGLSWGHLAQLDLGFTSAAVRLLEHWNDDDLVIARSYHLERGPEPIEQSLSGGHVMFARVKLPDTLPDDLQRYRRAQDRWLSPILSPERPRYIGSWNATAMFMVALFSKPALAAGLLEPVVMLPPGGPIFNALTILHHTQVLARRPAGSALDDEAFEPGAIYENNGLFVDLLRGHSGWNLMDVHSGLYMLGTRLKQSNSWF